MGVSTWKHYYCLPTVYLVVVEGRGARAFRGGNSAGQREAGMKISDVPNPRRFDIRIYSGRKGVSCKRRFYPHFLETQRRS